MDSMIAAAARALAAGDALGALNRVALRDDAPALALRGIAMAQLGEHPRSRKLLQRAARAFGANEELARARCVVADAEVALAMRDLGGFSRSLAAAVATLEAHGDRANALHARLTMARRQLLLGRPDDAAAAMDRLDLRGMPPLLVAIAELATAELALRSLQTARARAALARGKAAAALAGVPALQAEVAEVAAALERPAARRRTPGGERMLRLDEVEALMGPQALVVDACRRGLRAGALWIPLARRPVLFELAQALAEAWPGDVAREALIARAFRARRQDESHRARLRVELGRLRSLAAGLASIEATERGFALAPRDGRELVLLVPPFDGEQASVVGLLADGTAWSTSALALAVHASQRTVQRTLSELVAAGRVRSIGLGRARRWLSPPLLGFTTHLLLPPPLPPG
jgi:hypothetical protein